MHLPEEPESSLISRANPKSASASHPAMQSRVKFLPLIRVDEQMGLATRPEHFCTTLYLGWQAGQGSGGEGSRDFSGRRQIAAL